MTGNIILNPELAHFIKIFLYLIIEIDEADKFIYKLVVARKLNVFVNMTFM